MTSIDPRRAVRMLAMGCGALVLVPLAAFAVLVAVQPSSFRIARTRTIAASREDVHALVSDVARFEPTLAVGEHDPRPPVVTRSSDTTQPGAWFQRARGADVSRFELDEVAPDHLGYEVTAGGRSRFLVDLTQVTGGTEVTYAIEGRLDTIVKRALWPFVGLDARVGPELEQSLAGLERALSR